MKRILFFADSHCGHISGLTPPTWQRKENPHYHKIEEICWDTYVKFIKEIGPVDGCAVVGDLVDGSQKRQAGGEATTVNEIDQGKMAIECLNKIKFKNERKFTFVYGTPYHVGSQGTAEKYVADQMNFPIGDTQDIEANGIRIRLRHKIGGTQTPVGGDIALRKKHVWPLIWKDKHDIPIPDVQVFGHIHRLTEMYDLSRYVLVLPGLQAWTKYGGQQCDSYVNWGLVAMDINEKKEWTHISEKISMTYKLMRLNTIYKEPQKW